MSSIAENLQDVPRREPFVPFRLVLPSDERYDIVDPGLAMLLKSEMSAAFPNSVRFVLIPFLHIASLKTIRNGQARRSGRRRR